MSTQSRTPVLYARLAGGRMLHWKITRRGAEGTHVLLYGEVTESATFGELKLLTGRVVFDFAGVRRLNSFGVRELLNFLDGLRAHCRLEAERCSPAVVNQMNMLPDFTQKITVKSIIVPLECDKCGDEAETTVEIGRSARPGKLPPSKCDECGGAMMLAEPEERYFAFLS